MTASHDLHSEQSRYLGSQWFTDAMLSDRLAANSCTAAWECMTPHRVIVKSLVCIMMLIRMPDGLSGDYRAALLQFFLIGCYRASTGELSDHDRRILECAPNANRSQLFPGHIPLTRITKVISWNTWHSISDLAITSEFTARNCVLPESCRQRRKC